MAKAHEFANTDQLIAQRSLWCRVCIFIIVLITRTKMIVKAFLRCAERYRAVLRFRNARSSSKLKDRGRFSKHMRQGATETQRRAWRSKSCRFANRFSQSRLKLLGRVLDMLSPRMSLKQVLEFALKEVDFSLTPTRAPWIARNGGSLVEIPTQNKRTFFPTFIMN